MEVRTSRHQQRPCGGIIQRGPRIGNQCENPAGADGLCHNCRRCVTFSRTDPKNVHSDGTRYSTKKRITALKDGLIVRMREDAKRKRLGKKPLEIYTLDESPLEKPNEPRNSLNIGMIQKIWTADIASAIIEKIGVLEKNQTRLEENQLKLIKLFKGTESQLETQRSSSSTTSKSDK